MPAFTSRFPASGGLTTLSAPQVIGPITVDPLNPSNTVTSIQSYLENQTAGTEYIGPTDNDLPRIRRTLPRPGLT